MIQLELIGDQQAAPIHASRFPWVVGRNADADWRLEAPGVWDRHLTLERRPPEGYFGTAAKGASLLINGKATESARLSPGDILELGSVKVRFGLAPAAAGRIRFQEAWTWFLWTFTLVGEGAILYWVLSR